MFCVFQTLTYLFLGQYLGIDKPFVIVMIRFFDCELNKKQKLIEEFVGLVRPL